MAKAVVLGKRPRHAMPRTTSMTKFSPDHIVPDAAAAKVIVEGSDDKYHSHHKSKTMKAGAGTSTQEQAIDLKMSPFLPIEGAVQKPVDLFRSSSFLDSCELCGRRLGPGRDTYMYSLYVALCIFWIQCYRDSGSHLNLFDRGDSAFCSQECREQQMGFDSTKNHSLPSLRMKK